jgi:hypothetical protein
MKIWVPDVECARVFGRVIAFKHPLFDGISERTEE